MKKYKVDLQLKLYSDILQSDYLHYGYWDNPAGKDPERVTLPEIKEAQVRHAEWFASFLPPAPANVLDVGGGMGAFSDFLSKKGYSVTVLTPDSNQIAYINTKYPHLKTIHSKFEDIDVNQLAGKFDIITMLESCQYINPDKGLNAVSILLNKNGKLLISDYFVYKKTDSAITKSGHVFDDFVDRVGRHGLKLSRQADITDNILPTLYYLNQFGRRIAVPLTNYLYEKLRMKSFWFFIFGSLAAKFIAKMESSIVLIDPVLFKKSKKYTFLEILK
jgi:2-polyprenyl-3-methyl-5-hydroxy-6-metoxy-1,4-benzoquinol methylase